MKTRSVRCIYCPLNWLPIDFWKHSAKARRETGLPKSQWFNVPRGQVRSTVQWLDGTDNWRLIDRPLPEVSRV